MKTLNKKKLKTDAVKDIKNDKKKVKIKADKKKIIRLAIFLIICIVVVSSIIIIARIGFISIKYKKYKDKMDYYQYSQFYNNTSSTSIEHITKSELIKMVLCVIFNIDDVPREYEYLAKTYDNQEFIEYAVMLGLIDTDSITKENEDSFATKKEAHSYIEYFYNDEQHNLKSKNSDNKIIKGELNKLLIELSEKYKLIYYNSDDETVNLVTKKSNMPKNYMLYPYIIDSIPNEIYEVLSDRKDEENSLSPRQVFLKKRYMYSAIDETITSYYENILNIDYKTITTEEFASNFKNLMVYTIGSEDINNYIDYVKTNKIKLEGKATALLPIIYTYNLQNFVRVKLEFKIANSDIKENILFGDSKELEDIIYESNTYTMYIDVEMGLLLNSSNLKMYLHSPAKNLIKTISEITIKE